MEAMWLLCKFLLLLKSYFHCTLNITLVYVPHIAMQSNTEEENAEVRARQSSLWCTCYYRQLFIVKTWLRVFILQVSRIRRAHCCSLKAFISHVFLFHCFTVSLLFHKKVLCVMFLWFTARKWGSPPPPVRTTDKLSPLEGNLLHQHHHQTDKQTPPPRRPKWPKAVLLYF